jgi:Xaa-Pro dipeptidase
MIHHKDTKNTKNHLISVSSVPSCSSLYGLLCVLCVFVVIFFEEIMLTAEGCRRRREQLWQRLEPKPDGDYLLLADPIHLMYLANCWIDPFSLGTNFDPFLLMHRDGRSTLIYDKRSPKSVEQAHVAERRATNWYDGQSPGKGARQLATLDAVLSLSPTPQGPLRVHDRPGDPSCLSVVSTLAAMRRQKDPDEIDLLQRCMKATEAGHAWARSQIQPGMTELDVYCGVNSACTKAAGQPIIVYGDFAVSPGPERRGGPPTSRVLQPGDMFILDYSVVIGGYRSDFTNTLVVGGKPTADQKRLCDLCLQAMSAGEKQLRASAACLDVYRAVRGAFERAGMAEYFPHHAGHGLGLTHPEAPFFVREANETLLSGDVVTLEPGLYVPGVGGIRIEHNYLVTQQGYERLSHHEIAL